MKTSEAAIIHSGVQRNLGKLSSFLPIGQWGRRGCCHVTVTRSFRMIFERIGHADQLRVVPGTAQQLKINWLVMIVKPGGKHHHWNTIAAPGVSRRPKLARLPPPSFTLTSLNRPGETWRRRPDGLRRRYQPELHDILPCDPIIVFSFDFRSCHARLRHSRTR